MTSPQENYRRRNLNTGTGTYWYLTYNYNTTFTIVAKKGKNGVSEDSFLMDYRCTVTRWFRVNCVSYLGNAFA